MTRPVRQIAMAGTSALRSPKVQLLLRTPPPFGGGELLGLALQNFVKGDDGFVVLEQKSGNQSKSDQGRFRLGKLYKFMQLWIDLLRSLIKEKPALVCFPLARSFPHFVRDSILVWTCRLLGAAVAGELHTARFEFLRAGGLQAWYGKLVLCRLACLRVLGRSIAAELRAAGINNTIVSDNGVAPICPGNASRKDADQGRPVRLLFAGAISAQKGFSDLVRACDALARRGMFFQVDIVGEWISPDYSAETERVIEEKGLSDTFVFHGVLHGDQKQGVFAASDVLVLPSHREGQPLVILEALSCSLPVVATNVGAIPDTIQDTLNGYLVAPGDVAALAERLSDLIEHADVRRAIAVRNRRLYEERFTQEAFLRTQVYWLRQCAAGQLEPRGQFIRVE